MTPTINPWSMGDPVPDPGPDPNADYGVFWDERDYISSMDTDGLVAFWRLSANKNDSSGHGHLLTSTGTPVHGDLTCLRDLRVDRAPGDVSNRDHLSTNIASGADWMECESHVDFDATTAITISVSFVTSFELENRALGGKTSVWTLKHDAGGHLYFEITTTGGIFRVTNPDPTALQINHRAIGTYDAATGHLALYLDGKQVGFATATGNLAVAPTKVRVGASGVDGWFGRLSHFAYYKDRYFTARDAYADWGAALLQLRNPFMGYSHNAIDGLGDHIFWLIGGGIVTGDRLTILAADIQSSTSIDQGWIGFTCTDFSGKPDTWEWEDCLVPATATANPSLTKPTVTSFRDGDYYYGIGRNMVNRINWTVCRWPIAEVAAGDLRGAKWWNGSTWVTSPGAAVDLMPDTDAGAGGSMFKLPDGTWCALQQVNEGSFVRTRGAIRTAPAITGPWSASQIVVVPPGFDVNDGTRRWYAPSAHPEIKIPGGGIFVTWADAGDPVGWPTWIVDDPQLGWYRSGIIYGLPDEPRFVPWLAVNDLLVQVDEDGVFPTRYLGVGDIGDTVLLGDGRVLWLIGDNRVSGNDADRGRHINAAGLRNALGLWEGWHDVLPASAIAFEPTETISATDVQMAIEELEARIP